MTVLVVDVITHLIGFMIVFISVLWLPSLIFCFFLHSVGLMFTAGLFVATDDLHYNIFTVCCLLILASLLGNSTRYGFGKKTGPLLYRKKDSRFFKQEYLKAAEKFYEKYGGIALTAGLFFPIIRTFAPIVAGVIKLNFRKFILFTFIGSVAWVLSFVLTGYF